LGEGLRVDSVDRVVAEDFCQGSLEAHRSGSGCLEGWVVRAWVSDVHTALFLAAQLEADLWEGGAGHDHPLEDVDVCVGAGWGLEDAGVGGEGGSQGKAKA